MQFEGQITQLHKKHAEMGQVLMGKDYELSQIASQITRIRRKNEEMYENQDSSFPPSRVSGIEEKGYGLSQFEIQITQLQKKHEEGTQGEGLRVVAA